MGRHVRAAIYCAEEMIANMPPGVDQWITIANCANITMPPQKFLKEWSKVFLANYPERVHKAIIYPVPKFVVQFVKSLISYLPTKTSDKFLLLDTVDGLCQ